MSQLKKIAIFSITFIGMVSCKTPNVATRNIESTLVPTTYTTSKDTTNAANQKWEVFYRDENLKNLINTAIINNFDLQDALQKIEIAQNQFQLRKSELLPNASAIATAGQRRFGLFTMDGAGNASTNIRPNQVVPEHLPDYLVGLTTSWEADVWAKLRNNKKAAFARYNASIAGKDAIRTMLIAQIASTYYELLALDNELDIINENIKLQLESLEIIKVKKEAGLLNELAVKQFEGQVFHSKAFELKIKQQIVVIENQLNFLCGRYPQQVVREKSSFNITVNKLSEGIPSQLLQLRPDIIQLEQELLAAKFDVKVAKAAFYPSFMITGNVGFQAFQTALLFQTPQSFAYSLLGGLTAPLLNRKAIKVKFNTASANQIESLLKYQKTILNSYIEVVNEISNIKNLENITELQNQEVFYYSKSVETANDLFRSGRATYLEVLTVQRTVLESKIDLLNSKKQQHQAAVKLYKELGGGWQ